MNAASVAPGAAPTSSVDRCSAPVGAAIHKVALLFTNARARLS